LFWWGWFRWRESGAFPLISAMILGVLPCFRSSFGARRLPLRRRDIGERVSHGSDRIIILNRWVRSAEGIMPIDSEENCRLQSALKRSCGFESFASGKAVSSQIGEPQIRYRSYYAIERLEYYVKRAMRPWWKLMYRRQGMN
jgi:hypothetical protein